MAEGEFDLRHTTEGGIKPPLLQLAFALENRIRPVHLELIYDPSEEEAHQLNASSR